MADVFLSYARPSAGHATRVAAALRQLGYSVWMDQELPAHRPYSQVIEEQLEAAKAVLVLWSREAAQSQWVRSEANRARETGRLVQARLDDARLPLPFDEIQCADLSHWPGKGAAAAWNTVVGSIATLLDHGARPAVPGTGRSGTPNRRTVLIGAGAAALAAAGGAIAWRSMRVNESSPEAQLLLQKGLDALQSTDALDADSVGSTAQAIALLTEATEKDPKSAAAWGALAMAYAVRKRAADPAERPGLEARSRSAAKAALKLQDHEPRAIAALRLIEPVYRNWLNAERESRQALSRNPGLPILLFLTSDLLGSVGRWREAAQLSARFDRSKFLIPGADRKMIINHWAAGDLQAADQAARIAVEHWPDHPQVWRTRIAYLLHSGRPAELLTVLADRSNHPPSISPEFIAAAEATGMALLGRADTDGARAANLAYLKHRAAAAPFVAQACTATGDKATALAILDGYYFGEGEWGFTRPPAGDEDLQTGPLFQPPMKPLWADARFSRLLSRIGLEQYWRQSGSLPDYRRA